MERSGWKSQDENIRMKRSGWKGLKWKDQMGKGRIKKYLEKDRDRKEKM